MGAFKLIQSALYFFGVKVIISSGGVVVNNIGTDATAVGNPVKIMDAATPVQFIGEIV